MMIVSRLTQTGQQGLQQLGSLLLIGLLLIAVIITSRRPKAIYETQVVVQGTSGGAHKGQASLVSTAQVHSLAQAQAQISRPNVVLVGDSLTQMSFAPGGWGAAVTDAFIRKADVYNRGVSGYNTWMTLYSFDSFVAPLLHSNTTLVTLCLGANDAFMTENSHLPGPSVHVPLNEYGTNLGQIIDRIKALTAAPIILMTPPPVHEPGTLWYKIKKMNETLGWGNFNAAEVKTDRRVEVTRQYSRLAASVGAGKGVEVVDLFQLMDGRADWGTAYFLQDGLHFSEEGSVRVAALLLAAIRKHVKVSSMPNDVLTVKEMLALRDQGRAL